MVYVAATALTIVTIFWLAHRGETATLDELSALSGEAFHLAHGAQATSVLPKGNISDPMQGVSGTITARCQAKVVRKAAKAGTETEATEN